MILWLFNAITNTISKPLQTKHNYNMPFCKFCKDSGKTQQEFTSHYPKDKPGKGGKVVCPTILANNCRYCHEKGHAKSHCPVLKAKNSRKRLSGPNHFRRRVQSSSQNLNDWVMSAGAQKCPRKVASTKPKAISHNAFSALVHDDDESTTRCVALPKVAKPTKVKGTWAKKPDLSEKAVAERLASKKQEIAEAEAEKCREDVYDARVSLNRAAYEVFNQEPVPSYIGSWADAVDSEDEYSEGEFAEGCDSFGRPVTDNSAW
jgi:hypothetical protein